MVYTATMEDATTRDHRYEQVYYPQFSKNISFVFKETTNIYIQCNEDACETNMAPFMPFRVILVIE